MCADSARALWALFCFRFLYLRHCTRLKCCFTSRETVGLLGTGAQDGHLDFHTAPELWETAPTSHILVLPGYSPLVQQAASHSLRIFLRFMPASSSQYTYFYPLRVVFFRHACWLCVRWNDCRHRGVVRQGILNLSLLFVSAVEFSFSGYVPTEHKPSSEPKFQHKQIFRQHPTDQFILTSSLWKPNSL